MSATKEAVSSSDTGKPAKGPGERLQAARIQQGLALEDVANRMHLSTGILEALEENNFDEITAPIFVKGYLRAYARIVSLDEEEMIGLYSEYHRDEDPPISSINNVGSELTAADARIRWTTYFVILVLLTLLGAWWWNRQNTESTPISLDSQVDEEVLVEGAEPEPLIEAISEETAPPPLTALERPADPATGFDGEDAAASAPLPSDADGENIAGPAADEALGGGPAAVSIAAEPVTAAAGDDSQTPPDDLALADRAGRQPLGAADAADRSSAGGDGAAPAEAPTTARPPAVIAPSGAERLAVKVHADTWADIKDGSGFRLVYDLLRAGSSVELTGEAPFAVFLGNGHGVELQYNGEPVDFSADIRDNNTARLSIGE